MIVYLTATVLMAVDVDPTGEDDLLDQAFEAAEDALPLDVEVECIRIDEVGND